MKKYNLLFLAIIITAFTACQNQTSTESEDSKMTNKMEEMTPNKELAYKYGLENFSHIDSLYFTFNVRPNAAADTISRNWLWIPKKEQVALQLNGEWITYKRDTIQSEQFRGMDAAFINDQYWLIFPFRTLWDSGKKVSIGNDMMPFTSDSVATMTIAYTDSTGYTPNDTYKLFMDSKGMVAAWEYYHRSNEEPSITTSWEDVKTYNGIKIPTKFMNSDNGFAIFFTGIEIK